MKGSVFSLELVRWKRREPLAVFNRKGVSCGPLLRLTRRERDFDEWFRANHSSRAVEDQADQRAIGRYSYRSSRTVVYDPNPVVLRPRESFQRCPHRFVPNFFGEHERFVLEFNGPLRLSFLAKSWHEGKLQGIIRSSRRVVDSQKVVTIMIGVDGKSAAVG